MSESVTISTHGGQNRHESGLAFLPRIVTILYDKTGKHYGRGTDFRIRQRLHSPRPQYSAPERQADALIRFKAMPYGPPVHGQILLKDTFNRGTVGTPVALNGSSPTFSAAPESWIADSTITTNGTAVNLSTPDNDMSIRKLGYIGIPGLTGSDLTVGTLYTLSFTISKFSGGSWMGAGFGTLTNTEDVSYIDGNSAGFWALNNGSGLALFDEVGGTIHQIGGANIAGVANVILQIQVGATSDTLRAFVNGNAVSLSPTSVNVDPIDGVFVDSFQSTGSVEDLILTAPEPSTWAMLLGGFGVLLLASRLRRTLSL